MHLRQSRFIYSDYRTFTKKRERIQNVKKQKIQDSRFLKTNYIKLVFNMTWLMEALRIYLEEQFLIKYYVIKDLILYDGYQWVLASMVYKFFDKKTSNTNRVTGINSDVVSENQLHTNLTQTNN